MTKNIFQSLFLIIIYYLFAVCINFAEVILSTILLDLARASFLNDVIITIVKIILFSLLALFCLLDIMAIFKKKDCSITDNDEEEYSEVSGYQLPIAKKPSQFFRNLDFAVITFFLSKAIWSAAGFAALNLVSFSSEVGSFSEFEETLVFGAVITVGFFCVGKVIDREPPLQYTFKEDFWIWVGGIYGMFLSPALTGLLWGHFLGW